MVPQQGGKSKRTETILFSGGGGSSTDFPIYVHVNPVAEFTDKSHFFRHKVGVTHLKEVFLIMSDNVYIIIG